MFSSIRARLWLSYALVVVTALSVVAIVMFIYLLRNPFLYRQTLERLKAVETVVLTREAEQDGQPLTANLDRLAGSFDVRLILYSADRQTLADTRAGFAPAIPYPRKTLLSRAVPIARDANGKSWLYTLSQLTDQSWLLITVPRPRLSVLNVFRDELLPLFLQGGLAALLLSLFAAFVFARWVADPLQRLVAAAHSLPSELPKNVVADGPREVQDLTRAFNSMMARLHSSQKSQRDFIANVSHELKTPLTSVQGFAQAILDDTAGTPEARRQAAEIIYNEAGRMHRMVVDLLDLARLDAGTADISMSPLDTCALLTSLHEKLTPQAQHAGVVLRVETESNLPPISGDGDKLAQIFTNLVDNALKFSPAGGQVLISAQHAGAKIQISVSDEGPGIASEDIDHIFDRFYQADKARQGGHAHGVGLGLAIAREIVHAHGGTISVRSQPGRGTTFIVELPLSQSEIPARIKRGS